MSLMKIRDDCPKNAHPRHRVKLLNKVKATVHIQRFVTERYKWPKIFPTYLPTDTLFKNMVIHIFKVMHIFASSAEPRIIIQTNGVKVIILCLQLNHDSRNVVLASN